MLQLAQNELLSGVADQSHQGEEDFFEGIEAKLHNLCEEIAKEVDADSAAVFFATEEHPSGSRPIMVMRGASGRLKQTFDARVKDWRSWRRGEFEKTLVLSGFAYRSQLSDDFLALKAEERQQAIRGWSVTNQIWHLAQGRIANSNHAMDQLHGGRDRTGLGDAIAYPGKNLHTTFRTMIGVPIFAQGGSVQTVESKRDETREATYPSSASPSAEFLSKYRVIGILKVEGKQPIYDAAPEVEVLHKWLARCFRRERTINALELSVDERQQITGWCESIRETSDTVKTAFSEGGTEFPEALRNPEKDDSEKRNAILLRKSVVDVVSRCCHAEFTRQDMELLVLLAMQEGHLMTHRVIKYAADQGIIISENEVGMLNVRRRDINQLVALRNAAEAATRKVKYHLEALKAELDFAKRQEVYRAQVSELLDPRGPARTVTARTKESISLVRKLMRKHRHLEDYPYGCEAAFTDLKCRLEGHGHHSGERCIVRGSAQLSFHSPDIGKGEVDVKMKLGTEGAPQVTVDERNLPVALCRYQDTHDPDAPLTHRILDKEVYRVDDLAGARVITDYDSDVDELLEELRARVEEWGIEMDKVDDLREGKEGGYRAVHVTLYVDVKDLISTNEVQTLIEALESPQGQPLKFPVELQLLTAYQHSWAIKVHNILYKREEQIAQELRDEQEILSNVLAEADSLSDIVRSSIESRLLPPDYGERRLLEHLQRRIHPDDLHVVRFGVACAKEMLKDNLRYNGLPEFSFVMEICDCLVERFRVIDSTILLLALLHNIWRAEHEIAYWPTLTRGGRQAVNIARDGDIVFQLCKRLEQTCDSVLSRYRRRLPLSLEQQQDSDWLRIWIEQFPTWFWAMQRSFRDYFLQPPEDIAKQWNDRLQNIYFHLKWRHQEGRWRESLDDWLERAYMLEAAILLATLTELPFEPGGVRRKRLYHDYLSLYREIRKYLPNGPTKTRVIEELDRAFREIETQLDLSREPEWWGE